MGDTPLPNVGASDAERDDQTIQREWDRFAMSDRSDDLDLRDPLPTLPWGDPATKAFAKRALDSLLTYVAPTARADAYDGAESSDAAGEGTDAAGDGASS